MKVDDDIESLRWLAREFDALSKEFQLISVDENQIKNKNLKRQLGGAPRNHAESEEWYMRYLENSQIKKLEFEDQLYKEAFWEFPLGGPSGPQQNEVVGFCVRELYGKNPDLLKRAFRALGMDKSQIHFMSQSVRRMCGEMYGFLDTCVEKMDVPKPSKQRGRTILKVLAGLCRAKIRELQHTQVPYRIWKSEQTKDAILEIAKSVIAGHSNLQRKVLIMTIVGQTKFRQRTVEKYIDELAKDGEIPKTWKGKSINSQKLPKRAADECRRRA
jgi:hypothetical protein